MVMEDFEEYAKAAPPKQACPACAPGQIYAKSRVAHLKEGSARLALSIYTILPGNQLSKGR